MEWDWVRQQAARAPERLALVEDDRILSYAALDDRVARAVGWLRARGTGPGDRVAVHLPAGSAWVELLFALVRLRATLVPLNLRLTAAELGRILADAEPALVVTDAAGRPTVAAAWTGRTAVVEDPGEGWDAEPAEGPAGPPDGEDLQSIVYTSGTTGAPKGARIRLAQHFWGALGSMLRLGHLPDDVWLLCMPPYHVGGQAILFRAALAGTAVVVHSRFDAQRVATALADGSVTLVSLVPTMLRRVLDELTGPVSPRLRVVLLGGSAAPAALVQEARGRGLPVRLTYGLTETASQLATEGLDERAPAGASGRPLAFAEVAVGPEDGRPGQLPPGVPGEILARGPQVTDGYWRRDEPDRFAPGGWLRTGDLGWLDERGWLYVLDRRVDLIVSGGENVYPAEVEAALAAHPAVAAAAVVARADPEWGQVPVAFVVRRPDAAVTEAELLAFARGRLAGYKVPRRVWFVEALPLTGSGKIARHRLRAEVEAGRWA
jgi:O-succinylbenzoic acid--CoA ligase